MAENSTKTILTKTGLPPGALIHVGKKRSDKVKITVTDYDEHTFSETVCEHHSESFQYRDTKTTTWINIDGLHQTDVISAIGEHYDLHHLLLEDVLNTGHRPKVEEYDNCLFMTMKMLGVNKHGTSVVSEQVSFVLGDNWLISFQEKEGDIFDGLRQRLRDSVGVIRKNGPDYLLYRLIDTIVDNYFFVTEHFGEVTEDLEETIIDDPDEDILIEIQRLKKMLIKFRKSVMPLREAIALIDKDGNKLIKKPTLRYLRDVYEHVIQVSDFIESQRDMLASLMDLYLSGVSNKMNQVMQVLTIMATIFIPLTFIAGIYGMNFDNMPELHWKYGYQAVWVLMGLVLIGMVWYFKRKKWL